MKSIVVSDVHLRDEKDAVLFSKFLEDVYKTQKYNRLVLLGDIFDYWMEYHSNQISADFVPFICQLKQLLDRGVKIDYYLGNHDWWHKNFFKKMGINIFYDEFRIDNIGKLKILFSHSDRLVGSLKYKALLFVLHNKLAIFLYRSLPSWIGDFMAKKFSATSREANFSPDWNFINKLKRWVSAKKNEFKFDVAMFGHTHQEVDEELNGVRFVNTGAWEYNRNYYIIEDKKIEKYYWKEN